MIMTNNDLKYGFTNHNDSTRGSYDVKPFEIKPIIINEVPKTPKKVLKTTKKIEKKKLIHYINVIYLNYFQWHHSNMILINRKEKGVLKL